MFSASLHNQPINLPLWRDFASHSTLAPPSDHTPTNTAKPPSASDLNKEITAQKESSFIWQLMSRLLAEKAGESAHGKQPSDAFLTDALFSAQSTYALSIEISMSHAQSAAETSFSFSFSFIETVSEQIRVQTETGFVEYTRFSFRAFSMDVQAMQSKTAKQSDPLQIDIDGDGFETGGRRHAVSFDINADSVLDKVSFAHSDDAVLALDWNLNGIIDNGSELFGDKRGHANGFAALAQLDSNNDRLIDKNDAQFAHLKLLQILQDGRQQLRSLTDAGIVSLSLQFQSTQQFSSSGDRISATADVLFADGRRTKMGELWYQYR